MPRVADSIRDGIGIAIPQATEWQRIGNQIDVAMIPARADFVNVCRIRRCYCGRIGGTGGGFGGKGSGGGIGAGGFGLAGFGFLGMASPVLRSIFNHTGPGMCSVECVSEALPSLTISAKPVGVGLYLKHGSKDVSFFVPMKGALHFWNYSMFC